MAKTGSVCLVRVVVWLITVVLLYAPSFTCSTFEVLPSLAWGEGIIIIIVIFKFFGFG